MLLSIVAFILCTHLASAQEEQSNPDLEWKEGRRLVWADYPFIRLRSSKKEIALTSVKHSVVGIMRNGSPDFEVKVLFIAKDSWTTDTTNLDLLAHEQLHFDIGELYRRKVVEKIERLQKSGQKQRAIYRYAIRKLLSDFREFSTKYDKATRHGLVKKEQEKWRDEVWSELNRLQ